MSKFERRLFSTELRLDQAEGQPTMIRGHAAVFNSLSEDLGGFRERIKPGAFSNSLRSKPDVRALFNHDSNFILGRTKSGTLRVTEDEAGLHYEIDPADTTVTRDLMESLKRGDIDQSSFAFRVITDSWHKENGAIIRELEEVDIDGGDVSPVTYPAYPQTSAEARAFAFPDGIPEQIVRQLEGAKPDETAELRSQLAEVSADRDELKVKLENAATSISEAERQAKERLEASDRVIADLRKQLEVAKNAESERMKRAKAELDRAASLLVEASGIVAGGSADLSRRLVVESLTQ